MTSHADLPRDTAANPVALCAAPRLGPQLASTLPTLTVLDRPEAAGPGDRLLILYPGPVPAMAAGLAAGGDVTTVLADWTAQAGALLGFLRRNRRRILLAEEGVFLSEPAPILARLALPAPAEGALSPDPSPDPILALLAAEILRRDPTAHAMAGELEASAAASRSVVAAVDLEVARQLHLETAEAARLQTEAATRLQTELEEGRVEQEAVLRQLLTLQAEQERLRARIHQLDQGLQSTESQLKEQTADLALQADQRRALEEEKASLAASLAERIAALAASNQETETLRAAKAQGDRDLGLLTKRLTKTERDLADRQREVHKLRTSTSWRITAPVRWVKRTLSGKG